MYIVKHKRNQIIVRKEIATFNLQKIEVNAKRAFVSKTQFYKDLYIWLVLHKLHFKSRCVSFEVKYRH